MEKLRELLIKKFQEVCALKGTRVPIRLYKLLRKKDMTPTPIFLPPGKKILVLAPHMDDEIIGCGGTLYKHVRDGAEVTVVFMTNGKKGPPRLDKKLYSRRDRKIYENGLDKKRKEEARNAAEVIGIKDLIFLDYQDRSFSLGRKTVCDLSSQIQKVNPDLVYLPFLTDPHHDHWMTNKTFVHAIKRQEKGTSRFMCCGYEVWNPIYPNCLVEIKDVIEVKRKALQEYKSQLGYNNYIYSIFGLHCYRSMIFGSQSYAEAFFLTTAEEYVYMYEQMLL